MSLARERVCLFMYRIIFLMKGKNTKQQQNRQNIIEIY